MRLESEMNDTEDVWLSMILVEEVYRGKGALHRLLDDAKNISDVVVIPEPMGVVPQTAAKAWIYHCKKMDQ